MPKTRFPDHEGKYAVEVAVIMAAPLSAPLIIIDTFEWDEFREGVALTVPTAKEFVAELQRLIDKAEEKR